MARHVRQVKPPTFSGNGLALYPSKVVSGAFLEQEQTWNRNKPAAGSYSQQSSDRGFMAHGRSFETPKPSARGGNFGKLFGSTSETASAPASGAFRTVASLASARSASESYHRNLGFDYQLRPAPPLPPDHCFSFACDEPPSMVGSEKASSTFQSKSPTLSRFANSPGTGNPEHR
eukprot:TRINITY_DN15561_c0_g1_i1.p1 TRINITY_DN15561_c0_g1~~TRINITY_DN15561_c0_g1_i1.p1  ORF type:complete len:175 (+),score=26.99 TRINITY_DN15561_c0_g1_i1:76-600(+)